MSSRSNEPLHRVRQARHLEGVSIRTAAKRLNTSVADAQAQEHPDSDLFVSQLRAWQQVLSVPLVSLLEDSAPCLAKQTEERAGLVLVMKTALAIQRSATKKNQRILADQLVQTAH